MSTTIIRKIRETLARGQVVTAYIQGGLTFVYLGDKTETWPAMNVGVGLPSDQGRSRMFTVSVCGDEDCLTLTPESRSFVSSLKVGFGTVALIEAPQS